MPESRSNPVDPNNRPEGQSNAVLRPADLEAAEAPLASWFAHLERPSAPRTLRNRVFAQGAMTKASGRSTPAGRLLSMFPLGGWGAATAALILLALGAAVSLELLDPVAPSGAPESQAAWQQTGSMAVSEDPTMTLFHDLETFDEVGLAPGQLIADWHR